MTIILCFTFFLFLWLVVMTYVFCLNHYFFLDGVSGLTFDSKLKKIIYYVSRYVLIPCCVMILMLTLFLICEVVLPKYGYSIAVLLLLLDFIVTPFLYDLISYRYYWHSCFKKDGFLFWCSRFFIMCVVGLSGLVILIFPITFFYFVLYEILDECSVIRFIYLLCIGIISPYVLRIWFILTKEDCFNLDGKSSLAKAKIPVVNK